MKRLVALVILAVLAVGLVVLSSGRRAGRLASPDPGNSASSKVEEGAPSVGGALARSKPGMATRQGDSPSLTLGGAHDHEEEAAVEIEATIVDPEGSPIEGAELWIGDVTRARSDAQGRIACEVPWDDERLGFGGWFEIVKEGWCTHSATLATEPGTRLRLGRIVLVRGATLVGRLRSPWPRLFDAGVLWLPASELPEPADTQAMGELLENAPMVSVGGPARTDGTFELPGVPIGEGFLVGGAMGHAHAWSPVFRLDAGDRCEVDLDLVPDPERVVLAGRVVAPSGEPVEGASVLLTWAEGIVGGIEWVSTSANGDFALESRQSPLSLEAFDPEHRFYPASPLTPLGTDLDLELVLTEPRWLEIVLRDAQDGAIPWGHVFTFYRSGDASISQRASAQIPLRSLGETGRARVPRPLVAFDLRAMAPGFRTQDFGPLDPDRIEDPLILHLGRGQAVEGRVTHNGKPLAGASVAVFETHGPASGSFCSLEVTAPDRPFVYEHHADLQRDASTDRAGTFLATLHAEGEHAIAVVAEGLPTAFFGPFVWDVDAGASGIELDVPCGGTLEGRVLVAPGASPAGRIVGVASRFGLATTAQTDEDGRYRFENLAPGPYQVRPCVPPIAEREVLRGEVLQLEPSWDAEVLEGRATRVDLDLTSEGAVLLRGHFVIGSPGPGARVSLALGARRNGFPWAGFMQVQCSAIDGAFELRSSTEGSFVLRCTREGWLVEVPIDLRRGENEIEVTPAVGILRVRSVERDGQGLDARLTWENDQGWCATQSLWLHDPEDSEETLIAPTGRIRVETIAEDDDGWRLFAVVEVRPGVETLVELPY